MKALLIIALFIGAFLFMVLIDYISRKIMGDNEEEDFDSWNNKNSWDDKWRGKR